MQYDFIGSSDLFSFIQSIHTLLCSIEQVKVLFNWRYQVLTSAPTCLFDTKSTTSNDFV